jgi:hypothetical protein
VVPSGRVIVAGLAAGGTGSWLVTVAACCPAVDQHGCPPSSDRGLPMAPPRVWTLPLGSQAKRRRTPANSRFVQFRPRRRGLTGRAAIGPTRGRGGHPGRITGYRSTPIGGWQLSTTNPGTGHQTHSFACYAGDLHGHFDQPWWLCVCGDGWPGMVWSGRDDAAGRGDPHPPPGAQRCGVHCCPDARRCRGGRGPIRPVLVLTNS